MGYTTDFSGTFNLNKPLTQAHKDYINKFSETRRMKRDSSKLTADPIREAVGLPVGNEGAYFVGGQGYCGQDRDSSVLDYNNPPIGQPGLWCQWRVSEDGSKICWDGGEKFYRYVEWIEYLINHFLSPWGYTLNGEVEYQGEESDDFGKIVIVNNLVSVKAGKKSYE